MNKATCVELKTINTEDVNSLNDNEVKRRTVAGPWRNVAEFIKVCNWLFGQDANIFSRQKALSQIKIWSVRRSTLCPAAILATGVMVDIQLKDETNCSGDLSEEDIRTLYASAFTRFFNFMSSIMQTNNLRTMYDTANELGLASFVVDLRHVCAHGQILPPLPVLRNTAKYCMQWLYDYYWKAQGEDMCDVNASNIRRKDKTQLGENVTHLMGIYDSALDVYMKGAHNIKLAKRYLHGKRFLHLKTFYNEQECSSMSAVFDNIAQQLSDLVKKRDAVIKDLSEIYIEAILNMNYFFKLTEVMQPNADKGLERLLAVTQTMFRMLALHDLLEDLFEALLDMGGNPMHEGYRRAGASFWAQRIVEGFIAFRKCKRLYKIELDKNPWEKDIDEYSSMTFNKISDSLRELLVYSGVDRKRTLILSGTIQRPWVWTFERNFIEKHLQIINEYTAPVIKSLLELLEPELSNTTLNTFFALIEAYLEKNLICENEPQTDKENDTNIYTVSDVLKELKCNSIDVGKDVFSLCEEEEPLNSFGIWSCVQDDAFLDWKSCPLGRLPWE